MILGYFQKYFNLGYDNTYIDQSLLHPFLYFFYMSEKWGGRLNQALKFCSFNKQNKLDE